MKEITKDFLLLMLAVFGFFLMSVSFLLMPVQQLALLPGSLFWGGLLFGAIMLIVLETRRRVFYKHYGCNIKRIQKSRNGLMSICSNREATVSDCILLAGLVAAVPAFVFTKGTGYLCYVCISIVSFVFCLRCILNGRLYHHLKKRDEILKTMNATKASNNKKRRKRE